MLRRKCRSRKRGPEAENRHGWSAERRGVPIARDAGAPRKRPGPPRDASCKCLCDAAGHRCLASTGRLSALRHPSSGWPTLQDPGANAPRE